MLNFYEGHKVYMNSLYPAVFINGKNHHVHRLEWIKHHGEIPDGYVVHHKDEDKTNWNIDNLELISRSNHVLKHQNVMHPSESYGHEKRHHKLTEADIDYIRSHYVKYDKLHGGRSLAKQFGVSEVCISKIIKNKAWKVVV